MKIILASASPRRQELLKRIVDDFAVVPANIDETLDQNFSPKEYALAMAERKAQYVYKKYSDSLVIGCDTIVELDGKIMGKPENQSEAQKMLNCLSGRTHKVHTGISLIASEKIQEKIVTAEVTFFSLTETEITRYLATGEYTDKAGAYGIQGQGALLVKEIKGDFYTIVGLPVAHITRMLEKMGD